MLKGKYDPFEDISRVTYIERIWKIAQLFKQKFHPSYTDGHLIHLLKSHFKTKVREWNLFFI